MADVSRKLTLVDKFSSVWDKFIGKAEKAEASVSKVEAAEAKMGKTADLINKASGTLFNWSKAAENLDKSALLASSTFEDLILKGYIVKVGMQDIAEAAEGAAEKIGDIPEKVEAASVATEAWQDYLNRLDVTLPGITGRLENMWLTAVRFEKKFGESSEFAIEAQVRFDEALKESGLTMEQFKERLEAARKAQRKLGDDGVEAAERSEKAHSKLGRTLTRLGVMLFGLRKIVQAVRNAMARVPDEIIKPFNSLKSLLQDDLARVTTSLFAGMQKGLDRLNQAFESPAGRNFIAALQVGFEALGSIIGFIAEKVAEFMEFLFTQMETAEINFEAVGKFIGEVFGGVYVVIHNIVATAWNLFASFAEFLGNVFTDPLGSVVRLVADVVNTIVDVVAWAARQIDKLLGTNYAAGIMSFQDSMMGWVEEKFGQKKFTLERMEYIDIADTLAEWGAKGAEYGGKLQRAASGELALNAIKASSAETAGNTKAIKDAVTDEDLKMLIDVATQKFVSNVNLTAQTPVITINGANTGNTEADRRALAKAIKDILEEQMASGSTSGYYVYAGV